VAVGSLGGYLRADSVAGTQIIGVSGGGVGGTGYTGKQHAGREERHDIFHRFVKFAAKVLNSSSQKRGGSILLTNAVLPGLSPARF
jgi:hypothetical protein